MTHGWNFQLGSRVARANAVPGQSLDSGLVSQHARDRPVINDGSFREVCSNGLSEKRIIVNFRNLPIGATIAVLVIQLTFATGQPSTEMGRGRHLFVYE